MATPKTVKTYPLTGVQKDFPIPFEYLARKFVVVTLIGSTRRELILNTDYRFTTATQVTTTLAWGPGQGYDLIEIRRFTSATERLVDFADGSILRAYDLNTSQVQSLHIAEEARDLTADTIGVNNDGNLDARARRIVNVADAIDDGDAINLRMEKAWAASTLSNATYAGQQAAAAAQSATAAQTQAGLSSTARTGAETARTGAESARDLALQYRNTAETHKNTAGTSATNSENSNIRSQEWASKAEDTVVAGGLYSSYHYSRKSAASASASASSASASAGSATTSQQQADRAQGYANGLNLPSATGNAYKFLRQKSDASGLEYIPLIGTVSKASGQASGSVIESGAVSGGWYVRFADGTQIIYVRNIAAAFSNSSNVGLSWTYPKAFSQVPVVTCAMLGTLGITRAITQFGCWQRDIGSAQISAFSLGAFQAGDACAFDITAIGRWD